MMKNGKSVLDVQSEIEAALRRLPEVADQLPDALKPLVRLAPSKGVRVNVSLRHAATDRQVKRNAPADSWSPESGVVSISYETSLVEEAKTVEAEASRPVAPAQQRSEDPLRDLILALARAEQEPNRNFIALKWFRDTYLPQQGYGWTVSPDSRHQAIVQADRRRCILMYRVPNPKNPQFPVTAIRLNRPLPEVSEILDQVEGSDFNPVLIRGERLSDTVLRERR